jgi:hypothetical protein
VGVGQTEPRCPRTLSAEQFAALPDRLRARQLRVKATLKGFRPRRLVLVTTLLDRVAYPAEALAALYLQRWGGSCISASSKPGCGWTSSDAVRRRGSVKNC